MAAPLVAALPAIAGIAARVLPMAASTAGRAAAGGAARMGASQATQGAAGMLARHAALDMGLRGIERMRQGAENRNQSFAYGSTDADSLYR